MSRTILKLHGLLTPTGFGNIFYVCILILLCSVSPIHTNAQTISSYPYVEDFETGMNGWSSGGAVNDWAWGHPSKSVITSAGSGQNCWVTGGLTGSFYKYNEASFVTSPVFDFTSLQHPYISCLVLWESEYKYDGANLQYSLDQGNSWTVIGANGDTDCINAFWYNLGTINFLKYPISNASAGWTGNVQHSGGGCQGGNGSGGWVQASHCIANLAGKSKVMFRFAFASGSTCNNFDGFAFDKITIAEAPQNSSGGDFTFTCTGSNKVNFTGIDSGGCKASYRWNFGDAASGVSDTSILAAPSHVFSAPGSYSVSMAISNPCGVAFTVTKTVNIISVSAIAQDLDCPHSTGGITLSTVGGTGTYIYNWSNASTTKNIGDLSVGTYTVTVTSPPGCPAIDSATVGVTPPVTIDVTHAAMCHTDDGIIDIVATGGVAPYTYNWGGSITSQNRTGLLAGAYSVTVTDSSGCSASDTITLQHLFDLTVTARSDTTIKLGGSAAIQAIANENPVTYLWTPPVELTCADCATAEVSPAIATTYYIMITDTNGCVANDSVLITVVPDYTLFIPNAFTPNGDGNNDFFRFFGNTKAIGELDIRIFDGWGEKVFESTTADFEWDGNYKGEPVPQGVLAYEAQIEFIDGYKEKTRKGTVMLIR